MVHIYPMHIVYMMIDPIDSVIHRRHIVYTRSYHSHRCMYRVHMVSMHVSLHSR
jgi:hypothetical protein